MLRNNIKRLGNAKPNTMVTEGCAHTQISFPLLSLRLRNLPNSVIRARRRRIPNGAVAEHPVAPDLETNVRALKFIAHQFQINMYVDRAKSKCRCLLLIKFLTINTPKHSDLGPYSNMKNNDDLTLKENARVFKKKIS